MPSNLPAPTLIDVLALRAVHQSNKEAFTFLPETGQEASLTYGELDRRARLVASWLQRHMQVGDRALLLYPPGLEYIVTLFGCLYAGVIAVPAYPPRMRNKTERIQRIASDCSPRFVLTTQETMGRLKMVLTPQISSEEPPRWIDPEAELLQEGFSTEVTVPEGRPALSSVAFLQYTSGSTSMPKGVIVTHGNIMHNLGMLKEAYEHTEESVFISWLPIFHDMGLIGNIFSAVHAGAHCVFMSPAAFIQRPVRWLEAVSRYRGTFSLAPNFALDLCCNKIGEEEKSRMDLSSWRTLCSGAEPIRGNTMKKFAEAFACCGFRQDALLAGYGLAEATLMVSCTRKRTSFLRQFDAISLERNQVSEVDKDHRSSRTIVSCGYGSPDQSISIVDPATSGPCAPGHIGEIWISGASVAAGYWNNSELTKSTFHAHLMGDGRAFLRTGDLGFLHQGELYVTGRIKDLIIIDGRNHYPQDIESAVEQAHAAIRPGYGAAFSVEIADAERLAIVYEIERTQRNADLTGVIRSIRRTISEYFDLQAQTIVLTRPGSVPKTSSGKIQRAACRDRFLRGELEIVASWSSAPDATEAKPAIPPAKVSSRPYLTRSEIREWLINRIAGKQGIPASGLDLSCPFSEYGLGSREAVALAGELEELTGRRFAATLLYDYSSIERLAAHLSEMPPAPVSNSGLRKTAQPGRDDIAVIGMTCRFPGARNIEEFWQLLCNRVDAIRRTPNDIHRVAATTSSSTQPWGGFIDDVDQFDAKFFSIAPSEAPCIDPQQRMVMEQAWLALEDAGLTREQLAGSNVGVFLGISNNDYLRCRIGDFTTEGTYSVTGNSFSVAANRVSYAFDWRGPSVAVDTACSSSLVAVHLACQSLLSGESNIALAGGVNLILSPAVSSRFSEAGLMAADGRCKTFDARADGYVRSEGVGVVVLKPLSGAIADGDRIYCVVRGSYVGQDGRSNGLLAPSRPAQVAMLREALRRADVAPGDIQFVEAHGTGTFLGDSIEVNALAEVLAEGRAAGTECFLGAVKTNIGHAESAAGIAGFIKTALALYHGSIPPNLHFAEPNAETPLANPTSFLKVPAKAQLWLTSGPHRAGVSSFGFGGTIAHVVLEDRLNQEGNVPVTEQEDKNTHILAFSAASPYSLQTLAGSYRDYLSDPANRFSLKDICFTAAVRRSHHHQRLAVVGDSHSTVAQALADLLGNEQLLDRAKRARTTREPQKIFVFPGQGGQWLGMGRRLLQQNRVFRQTIGACEECMRAHVPWSLVDMITNEKGGGLSSVDVIQPMIFAIQVGLSEVWKSWGIQPDVIMGQSMGEIAAAYVAGALRLEDAAHVVCLRSRLLTKISNKGAMAMAAVSSAEAEQILHDTRLTGDVFVAVSSSPASTVLSGSREAIADLIAHLDRRAVFCRRIDVDYASHCPGVEPIREELLEGLSKLVSQAPSVPMYSTVTTTPVTGQQLNAAYWWQNLRAPVLFAETISQILEKQPDVILEISPHPLLETAIRESLAYRSARAEFLPSMQRNTDELTTLLGSLGTLYTHGAAVRWPQVYPEGRFVSTPAYPFDRKSFWIEAPTGEMKADAMQEHNISAVLSSGRDESSARQSARPASAATLAKQPSVAGKKDAVLERLRQIVARLLQLNSEDIEFTAPFLEMGADSMVLARVLKAIADEFEVNLSLKQLFEQFTTLDALADFICATGHFEQESAESHRNPPDSPQQGSSEGGPAVQFTPGASAKNNSLAELTSTELERIFSNQLSAISSVVAGQLETLRGRTAPAHRELHQTQTEPVARTTSAPGTIADGKASQKRIQPPPKKDVFVAYSPIQPGAAKPLPEKQQRYLDHLIRSYTGKTAKSKEMAQAYRGVLADNRASAGFRYSIKEMLYPLHARSSSGAHIWDVDGNKYVDLTMGFGVNLFGHNPAFVIDAIEQQLKNGIHLGPQSDLAGEVAALVSSLTGMDRVTFCNSGTEAIMMALRLARTATGRRKVALFAGSYHGTFDGVLAQEDGRLQPVPLAPGVLPGAVEDVLVLDYADPQSLELLEKNAEQLAAVLVEPVQSRRPDLQPREFLHQLRALTRQFHIALIFDEVITGFRIAPGGAQEWFGIDADIATYGKIAGGGMPIGIIAGRQSYMDGIDGGFWQFGDLSYPVAETTFFAGTFCKHPLAMAAAKAVLGKIKEQGPALQQRLAQQTEAFTTELNEYFRSAAIPIQMVRFGSLFRFAFKGNLDLLFYSLLDKGVYIWEGRNCFLSTAHTAHDIRDVVNAVKETVVALQASDFLQTPGRPAKSAPSHTGNGNGHFSTGDCTEFPATATQKDLWLLSQSGKTASLSYNLPVALRLKGELQVPVLKSALARVIERHEALRCVFSADGQSQRILSGITTELLETDLSLVAASLRETALSQYLEEEAQQSFEMSGKVLWRAKLLKLDAHEHVLLLTTHHLVADGWSMGVLLHELSSFYSAGVEGRECDLPHPVRLTEYLAFREMQLSGPAMAAAEKYWLEKLKEAPQACVPLHEPRSATNAGRRIHWTLPAALYSDLSALSARLGSTLFMTLLAAYQMFLAQETGCDDVVTVIPTAGHSHLQNAQLVYDCSNLVAVRSRWTPDSTFTDSVKAVRQELLDSEPYNFYPFAQLVRKLQPPCDPSHWPMFNLDRPLNSFRFSGLDVETAPVPVAYVNFDFGLNITILAGKIEFSIDCKTSALTEERMQACGHDFISLLNRIVADPGLSLGSLDRRPSIQLQHGIPEEQQEYAAPRTPMQQVLAGIWTEVFSRKEISIFSNFFDLGGHSLLATQIVSRVRELLDTELGVGVLFQHPTIAKLSAHIETATQKLPVPAGQSIVPVDRNQVLPASFSQRRLWLTDLLEPGNTAYNISGVIRLLGPLDRGIVEKTLNEVVRRHEALRTVFESSDEDPVQRILPFQPFMLEVADISPLEEPYKLQAVAHYTRQSMRIPFDLATGPLMRASMLRMGADDHALVMVFHHIIIDGWSLGVLLKEICLLYDAFSAGKQSPLPELPIQFADYAVWQRQWMCDETLELQMNFWMDQLKGVPSFIRLPTDRPRHTTPSFRGAREPFALPPDLSESFRELCRKQGATSFMGLLAVFSLLLNRYSGQDDFVVGTDVANRSRLEIEGVVGCFVNLLPLPMRLGGDPSFRDYLQRTRALTLAAYARQDIPFDQLIQRLRPERKLTSTPLIQVFFAYENMPLPVLQTGNVSVEVVPVEMETTEFELLLSIEDTSSSFKGTLGYSTDLFDRVRIQAMISQFQALLEEVVAYPEHPLSAFSLIAENEQSLYSTQSAS